MLYGKKQGGSTYTEIVEIKSTPDTGNDPEQIDVTTHKDTRYKYVMGRQQSPNQNFTYNYTEANYSAVEEYCDGKTNEFLVIYPDGTGEYTKGQAGNRINGTSVNSAIEATLTIVPEEMDWKTSAEVRQLVPTLSI